MKKLSLILSFLTASSALFAQDAAEVASTGATTVIGLPLPIGVSLLILLIFIGFITILLIASMIDFGRFSYSTFKKHGVKPTGIIRIFGIFEGDLSSITSEYQDQVIHEYDGIQEYDNDMPPWWKVGFYMTIIFAIAYMLIYHVFDALPLQNEEYANQIEEAGKLYANVDQQYDGPITDKAQLKAASEIFTKNCKTCHGANAEGLVGPNLTDKFWLHGGTVNDVYTTIKYGKIEKNMPAWKANFNNQQVYEIASYILSLQGSNPANPKEPQGEELK